jgi:hypothetical protein
VDFWFCGTALRSGVLVPNVEPAGAMRLSPVAWGETSIFGGGGAGGSARADEPSQVTLVSANAMNFEPTWAYLMV